MENNKNLQTSVVLATYNGSQFIKEQLISIYNQTQKVDEVLIFDDKSTDSTVEICEKFINEKEIENWSIHVNENKLGVFCNFLNGILCSKGDVIFFSDQDDVWLDTKVKIMTDVFFKRLDVLSLTSTFSRFNKDIILNNHVKHPYRNRGGLKKIELNEFCAFPYYLGMSMAISKKLIKKIDFNNDFFRTIDNKKLVHDIFFNLISTINNGHYHLDKVLTQRRSYSSSVSNLKFKNELIAFNGNKKLYSIDEKIKHLKKFIKIIEVNKNKTFLNIYLKIIKNNLRVSEIRYNYIQKNNFRLWIQSIKSLFYYDSILRYFSDGLELIKSKNKVYRK